MILAERSRLAEIADTLGQLHVLIERLDSAAGARLKDCIEDLNGCKSAEERIMDEIIKAGGEFTGLYRLSLQARVDYHYAWDLINDMESRGKVSMSHKGRIGKPIIVRLNDGT